MPILAVWMGLGLVGVAAFCATALALSYGFWRYQRWEQRVIKDWSFLQWGEFVTGAFLGAGAATLIPLVMYLFL